MNRPHVDPLVLVFQLQSLIFQLENQFAWDRKNPWINRGGDGKFQENNKKKDVSDKSNLEINLPNKIIDDIKKKADVARKDFDELIIKYKKNTIPDVGEDADKNIVSQVKDLSENPDLKNGIILTASLLGVSVLSLLGLRARYIRNFDNLMKEKALVRAEEIMEELPSRLATSRNGPIAKSVTIVINGSVVEKDRERASARAVQSLIQKMLPNHKIIPLITDDTHVKISQKLADTLYHGVENPSSPINPKVETIKIRLEIYKGVVKNFIKGENPAAIEAAAQAIAHAKKYKVTVNGIGHCFGGVHLHDAQMIAKAAGLDLDVMALGTPYFGMTKPVAKSKTLVSPNDDLAKLPFWVSRDKAIVEGVDDHDSYFLSPNVVKEIKDFMEVK